MTLASSGSINMVGPDTSPRRSIGVELGNGTLTTPVSLLSAAVLALTGKSGGPITMPGDFYGRSIAYVFNDVIASSSGIINYNLRSRALAAGWDGSTKLVATTTLTDSTSFIISNSTASPALTDGSTAYPAGSTWSVINNGYILGKGGAAGAGGGVASNATYPGSNGSAGGTAILIYGNVILNIENNCGIGGGGGGGGGGGSAYYSTGGKSPTSYGAGGGGGGGGGGGWTGVGTVGGAGGSGGPATFNDVNYTGSPGINGAILAGGGSGIGGNSGGVNAVGGTGGAGGFVGDAGSAGSSGGGSGTGSAGGSGGSAGYSIYGISNVNLTGSGFVLGPQI